MLGRKLTKAVSKNVTTISGTIQSEECCHPQWQTSTNVYKTRV